MQLGLFGAERQILRYAGEHRPLSIELRLDVLLLLALYRLGLTIVLKRLLVRLTETVMVL